MAKTSAVNRTEKRKRMVARDKAKRAELKARLMDKTVPVEERFEVLRPYHEWATALGNNLRALRSSGYDPSAISRLRDQAASAYGRVNEENGWET